MKKLPRGSAKRGAEYSPPGKTGRSGVKSKGQFAGVDALERGGKGTTFGGRSPFGTGKAPSVDLGASVGAGNRRTAVAAIGGSDGGAVYSGHGFATRK